MPHTLERWGIPPPWGVCDSGADLESSGEDVLRGWSHVDLRLSDEDPLPSDVPVSGLLRTMWDALELYGTITLTGVDAILPPGCAGEPTWARLLNSEVLDPDRPPKRARALAQVGKAWHPSPAIEWDPSAVIETLSALVEVQHVMGAVDNATYRRSPIDQPFAPVDTSPFRAEVTLPNWTVDDAAFLTEVMACACHRLGLTQDVQIAVRLVES